MAKNGPRAIKQGLAITACGVIGGWLGGLGEGGGVPLVTSAQQENPSHGIQPTLNRFSRLLTPHPPPPPPPLFHTHFELRRPNPSMHTYANTSISLPN